MRTRNEFHESRIVYAQQWRCAEICWSLDYAELALFDAHTNAFCSFRHFDGGRQASAFEFFLWRVGQMRLRIECFQFGKSKRCVRIMPR